MDIRAGLIICSMDHDVVVYIKIAIQQELLVEFSCDSYLIAY